MNGQNEQRSNRGGVLKTTTWGAVISLSLLVAAWGFNGHWTNSESGASAQGAAAKLRSSSRLAAQTARPASKLSAPWPPSKSKSVLDFLGFGSGKGHSNPAPAGSATLSASSNSMPVAVPPAQAKEPASRAGTGSSPDSPATSIAAKIAPDLKGLDPEKPVDVIVQYRHIPSANELSSDEIGR